MASDDEPFLYTGQWLEDIPQDVRHVKVDPSIKVIGPQAFDCCRQLVNVELCEGLEYIDWMAFVNCTSLVSIIIPSTVKVIGERAFQGCNQLVNVELNEGLERIDSWAFQSCTSLESIIIPSTVKYICKEAFEHCRNLVAIELNEGLERIDSWAFCWCTSLESIIIPSTVNYIRENAFRGCERLLAIEFCNMIEQFVDEASLPWWNHGVSKTSLRTYSFLVQGNILTRLGTIKAQTWKDNIHDMLQRIPEVWEYDGNDKVWYEPYFDFIEHRLASYEHLQEVAPFLELALWKVKITEQSNGNIINDNLKNLCRIDSLSMFAIIFPNVFSFFFEE